MGNSGERDKVIRGLKKLGFIRAKGGKGSHEKYINPELLSLQTNQPPFITIPKKISINLKKVIIRELIKLGVDKNKLNKFMR